MMLTYRFKLLMIVLGLGLSGVWLSPVSAHKDHAGELVEFITTKELLRKLLPTDARLVLRKERVSDSLDSWAQSQFGYDLDKKIHTYYLAYDRVSGVLLGGAIIMDYSYRHGEVRIAVGMDQKKTLTGAALQGVSELYSPDFSNTVGLGLLAGYKGKMLTDLITAARSERTVSADRFVAEKIAETAVMIATFMRGIESNT